MRRIPEHICLGKLNRDELQSLFYIIQAESTYRTNMLASMEPEDEHYADAVTTAVIATKLFKKLRDRWEKDKGTQTVTIDITEAMVLWRIDGLGLDNYSGNVFRKIIEQTHLTLCNQPTLTALPATGLMVK